MQAKEKTNEERGGKSKLSSWEEWQR